MKKLTMLVAVLLITTGAKAASAVVDGVTWNYSVSNGKASVYKGTCYSAIPTATTGALIIPATLGGYPVTSIGPHAFYGCSGLKSVAIPEGVISIGECAFMNCTGLVSISIPTSATTIGAMAFSGCNGLGRVDISDLAKWCAIKFGEADTYEGRDYEGTCNPLYYAGRLYVNGEEVKELVIPDGVTCIGRQAFLGCAELVSVSIPTSVTTIGSSAFLGCSGLARVDISDLAKWCSIEFSRTDECDKASNPLCYAGRLYVNGEEVRELVIPDGVTDIGSLVFEGCAGVTSVSIPTSVTNIEVAARRAALLYGNSNSAFEGCSGIVSVMIPDKLLGLLDYSYGAPRPGTYGGLSIVFPSSYKTITNVTILAVDGNIPDAAFLDCSGLTNVQIPKSVTRIGEYAFGHCAGLKTIVVPDAVRKLGDDMFNGCTSLQQISIPSGVERIGERMFADCTGLTTVNLGNGLSDIGESAFQGCIGLRAMSFPENLRAIGNSAFSGCTCLATVSFSSGVSEVGVGAFAGCSVKSLLFDNSNGEFLDRFSKESLRTLFLGAHADGVTGGLLYDCSALETIMTAAANPNYCTDGGVLYDKEKTRLIKYPCAVTTARYDIPASVTDVDEGALRLPRH